MKSTKKIKEISVKSVHGHEMRGYVYTDPIQEVTLGEDLSSGFYILELHFEDGTTEMVKIIKSK